jgi:hypothetical protein
VFCIYLGTNSECHLHQKLTGFYNRDEKCLQRGTDWVFKYSSLRFGFKGLTAMVNTSPSDERTLPLRKIAVFGKQAQMDRS